MTSSDLIRRAESAVQRATEAGLDYGRLAALEMDLENDRPLQKTAAIIRIMENGPNPLTQKPHSASSAEAQVELDPAYRAYLRRQSECVLMKNNAWTSARSAQLLAALAITVLKVQASEPVEVAS